MNKGDTWNLISALLVGMSTTDPRYIEARDWLNNNRKYQTVIARLPALDTIKEKERAKNYLIGFKDGCDTIITYENKRNNK